MDYTQKIEIAEVCPRDGWQNHPVPIDTDTKIELIRKMMDCGPKRIEVTSFVNPKAVPQMADNARVVDGVREYAREKGVTLIGLALNGRGVDNARAAGLTHVSFGVSVSEEHNLRNSNKTIEASFEDFRKIMDRAQGMNVLLALPCTFGSPFGDAIDLDRVLRMCEEAKAMGVKEFGLADTAGISNPRHTREVLRYLKDGGLDFSQVSIHLHDTRGMGLANAWIALEEGITHFDASLGGMGGCPFVPGAKGNIATEDLVNMVSQMGMETGYDLDAAIALAVDMGGWIQAKLSSSMSSLCKKGH